MSLQDLRNRIDEIDNRLVELLNERAQIVVEVGKLKSKTDAPIYAPEREKQVFAKIRKANKGPLPDRALIAIWREMMSGSFGEAAEDCVPWAARQLQPYRRDAQVWPKRRV